MITEDQKEQIIELRSKGYSFLKIAASLKISKPTLIKITKEFQVEIRNAKEMSRDSILEKYKISQIHQLEAMGKLQEQLLTELQKRDLKTLSSHKLIDLISKNFHQIDKINNNNHLTFSCNTTELDINFDENKPWTL